MEDEKIIDLFFERSEQAIKEIDIKYGKIFKKLSYDILHNLYDAQECVNDAYLGAWDSIPPARPNPLAAYLCKIVRNLSLKRYYSNTALKRSSPYEYAMEELEDCIASNVSVESEIEAKELAHIIEGFLDNLSAENRIIFMRRYWFSDSYEAISRQVGISEKNVSVRLTRIRKALKKYLKDCEVLL